MVGRSSRRRRWLAALVLAALAAVGASVLLIGSVGDVRDVHRRVALAADFDPRTAPPPWSHRCRISIAAYEDGSASLYCGRRRRRFASIDAESGRIQMRMPWRRSTAG